MKSVSLILPTQNMSESLGPLLKDLGASGLAEAFLEIIVVNDGSTDSTKNLLQIFSTELIYKNKLKVIHNKKSQGRFEARRQGAVSAKGELVFFLDSRIYLIPGTTEKIISSLQKHSFLMGMTIIDISKSVFNLYWERTHAWIYRKHYQDVKKGFYLSSENYEQYSKGTGLLVALKDDFLKACDKLGSVKIMADDTLLIQEIVQKHPIYVTSEFQFGWEPRQNLSEFLVRLFDRGPGFVQYHFFKQRTRFFYASLLAFTFGIFVLWGSWVQSSSLLPGLLSLIAIAGFSLILVTRNIFEFLKMFFLHILVLISFSAGILYGIVYCLLHLKKSTETRT